MYDLNVTPHFTNDGPQFTNDGPQFTPQMLNVATVRKDCVLFLANCIDKDTLNMVLV
jgi:hypothetical protein